jgi:predicted Fe-Mo cluster-binding NifX family protein
MKIAISSCGDTLQAQTHALFGRCDYLVIVDAESGAWKAIKNSSAENPSGAGTACAQLMFDEGVNVVISGQVGPNASEVLTQSGISMFNAPTGSTVAQAVEQFKTGVLKRIELKMF